ncbi:MAG TPA: M64 family metallopeptidase [Gemmatimonadaceae bacterium]|nr:M64 family metallopeptidase [Gemmatimonadaceae bacterium]
MKRFLAAALCLAVSTAAVAPPPATWRLDFNHTGGPGVEIFSLDKIFVEPLPWSGHPGNNLDRTGFGTYRFEVRDTDGRVLFSRGYSPIFAEWITTVEAEKANRTFHESLRFPAPGKVVDIVVFKRDASNRFAEAWRTRVDPTDMFIDRSVRPTAKPLRVEYNGDPAVKVDVLLLGDGYTGAECQTKFVRDVRRMSNSLFSVEPYKSRRRDFNVWGLCPPSPRSGVSRPSTGVHIASPVGTTYDTFGSERYVLTTDNRAFRAIAAAAPYEFVTILVNSHTYGGGGLYNIYSTVAVDNEFANYLFIHEFGHHFAALADEYYTSPVAYQPPLAIIEPWEPNVTALLDRDRLKWRDLVTHGVPIPTPWPKERFEAFSHDLQARRAKIRAERRPESEMSALFREERAFDSALFASAKHARDVGAFQGANYDAKAFYRPAIDCIMFTRDNVPFCPVCQRAIAQVIDYYSARRSGG